SVPRSCVTPPRMARTIVLLFVCSALSACTSSGTNCSSSSSCSAIASEITKNGGHTGPCVDSSQATQHKIAAACKALQDCLGCGGDCFVCSDLFSHTQTD